MDIRWTALILLGAIGTGTTNAAEKIQVDVYVQQNDWTQPLGLAERLAAEMFGRIDVRLTWHAGELPAVPCAGQRCIGIRIVKRAPASLAPGALASARPYGSSGSLISVYQDRAQQLLNRLPSLSRVLLACVFVHELAHVMQGNDYHSDAGILRAQWSNADYIAMRTGRLTLTDRDSDRIRDGLAVRLAAR